MDVSRNNPNCCLLEPIESVEISNDLVGFLIDSLSKMLEFEINMDHACRSCLKEDSAMMTIHNPVDIDVVPKSSYTLAEILMECTTIKVYIRSVWNILHRILIRFQFVYFVRMHP